MTEVETKVCSTCGKEKPVSDFLLNSRKNRIDQCTSCYQKLVDDFLQWGVKDANSDAEV